MSRIEVDLEGAQTWQVRCFQDGIGGRLADCGVILKLGTWFDADYGFCPDALRHQDSLTAGNDTYFVADENALGEEGDAYAMRVGGAQVFRLFPCPENDVRLVRRGYGRPGLRSSITTGVQAQSRKNYSQDGRPELAREAGHWLSPTSVSEVEGKPMNNRSRISFCLSQVSESRPGAPGSPCLAEAQNWMRNVRSFEGGDFFRSEFHSERGDGIFEMMRLARANDGRGDAGL